MDILTDLQIEQNAEKKPIEEIAQQIGLESEDVILYGNDKAKVKLSAVEKSKQQQGKLILVTAISPTPAGEGKTTTSVGLADALSKRGHKTALALREPSLGPVFGLKGGASGGGYAQVTPMESINLHFTGDFHAISSAHNLLAALLDNHLHQGNLLNIDSRSITWKRVVDMNDRQLRQIVSGLGGTVNGVPREDGFDITVASEIMAILCLATDLEDLKTRLGQIIVAYNYEGQPVTAKDLKANGAMAVLLKDAIQPNLVQTLEHTPTFIHGGPFANIAHGCNSLTATKMALAHSDYTVTEAGFGADLGAEKFIDIKCRIGELQPDAVVIVATIRALKMHGGVARGDLNEPNPAAVEAGLPNLLRHLHAVRDVYGLPAVVAVNRFIHDTEEEVQVIQDALEPLNVSVHMSDVWAKGGEGALSLADEVVRLTEQDNQFQFVYDLDDSIEEKLTKIVQKVYGGRGIQLTPRSRRQLRQLESLGYDELPICVAKTPYSFSDNQRLINAPVDFDVNIRELKVNAGAGFIVALTGNVMTMPGLPKEPAANQMDIDASGKVTGLF